VLVYVGFNAALARWPSTRVYAWTFLVPVVAVLIDAAQGALPGLSPTVGIIVVIIGVAIVNNPRAEAPALPLIERAGVARPTTVGTDTLRQRIAEELASAHAVVTHPILLAPGRQPAGRARHRTRYSR
jgi:hypothetical protein